MISTILSHNPVPMASIRTTVSTDTKKVMPRMSPEEWKAYKRAQNANFSARKEKSMSQHEKELREKEREQRAATKAAEQAGEWVQTAPPIKKKKINIELSEPAKKQITKNLFANFNDDTDEEKEAIEQEPEQRFGQMKRTNWADSDDE